MGCFVRAGLVTQSALGGVVLTSVQVSSALVPAMLDCAVGSDLVLPMSQIQPQWSLVRISWVLLSPCPCVFFLPGMLQQARLSFLPGRQVTSVGPAALCAATQCFRMEPEPE